MKNLNNVEISSISGGSCLIGGALVLGGVIVGAGVASVYFLKVLGRTIDACYTGFDEVKALTKSADRAKAVLCLRDANTDLLNFTKCFNSRSDLHNQV